MYLKNQESLYTLIKNMCVIQFLLGQFAKTKQTQLLEA